MLVLSRKEDQSIIFPNLGISIEIVRVQGNKVSVGVEAPKAIRIVRGELQSAAQPDRQDSGSEFQLGQVVEMLAPEAQAELRSRLNTVGLAVHAAQNQFAAGGLENAEAFLHKAVEALAHLNKLFESPQATTSSDCVRESQPAYEIPSRTQPVPVCDRGLAGWFVSPAHSHQLVEYLQQQLCSAN